MKTSYWFATLGPFVSAVVAFATAAVMMRGSWSNPVERGGASIWDVC